MSVAVSHLERITIDPAINHGKPSVRGTRMSVQSLLELLASAMTFDDVLADHEFLERDDLLAVLEYAALTAGNQQIVRFDT